MPKYEYRCSECGHELSAEQRISDPALKTCPECQKDGLERLISNTSFALRGGGWYSDGYGSGKSAAKDTSTPDAKKDAPPKSDATSAGKTGGTSD